MEEKRLNFAGNCEGRDVLSGEFDVVACDGFTGNVLLKFLESVGSVLLEVLKASWNRRRGKVGSAFLISNLRRIKKRLDHAEHGGVAAGGGWPLRDWSRQQQGRSGMGALRLAHAAASHNTLDNPHRLSDEGVG